MLKLLIVICCILFALPSLALRSTEVTSLPGVIWGVGFIESNHLILSLRDGELYSYKMKVQTKKKLNPPNVIAKGQGGLMDVLYKSPYIYDLYKKILR